MFGKPPKIPDNAVPKPSAYVAPWISFSVASRPAPPLVIPDTSPTVSTAETNAIRQKPMTAARLNSKPYANGDGTWNAAARLMLVAMLSNETISVKNSATRYPAMMPIKTADTESMPFAKNFKPSVTNTTTNATDQFSSEPYSGLLMAGTPPAAYWMPTLTNAKPIIVTTRPVTSGGRAKRILPITVPSSAWKRPPTNTPPNRIGSASTPLPATSGIMIGMKAKLVP